jgi:ABC-type histidine transport system ATPase subunit
MATKTKAAVAPETAAPVEKQGIHIVAMQVDNILRVGCVRIRPKGDVITIGGKNGSGKSSILNAIEMAITGTRSIPSKPIKSGSRTGSIRVNFGEFEVLRTFTAVENGKEPYITKLTITDRHNRTYNNPQALLNGFMGAISFDPLAFIRMSASSQFETLLQLVNLDVDLEQLERDIKTAYDARRDAGRDLDAARIRLAALPAPIPNLPQELIDTTAIQEELRGAAEANSKRGEQVRAVQQARQEAIYCVQRASDCEKRADALEAEIQRLILEMNSLNEAADLQTKDAKRLTEQAEAMVVDVEVDTTEVAVRFESAQQTNAAIERRNLYTSVQEQVKQAEQVWETNDAAMKAKGRERADAMARAKMPIEGLGIGDREVLFEGFPFEQASNAAQIKASVALAIASNPHMRVLRIKDGSLLDDDSLTLVEKMAEENGYQVWIERVEKNGKVSVVMEDGSASGDDVEQVSK